METIGITYKTGAGRTFHQHKPYQFATRALSNDIQSVRLPVAYKNQRHLPGYFWMSRMGSLVAYESRLEMTILLQLDFNRAVIYAIAQPCVLHYQVASRLYRHTPDFLVRYQNGATELINVKPKQFVHTEKNRLAFAAAEQAAIEMGWAHSTRCEIDPVYLANLKWLAGYRRPPVGLRELGPRVIEAAIDSISIAGAIKAVSGLPALVRPVLFHMIWTGVLEVDLYARLTEKTSLKVSNTGSKP